MDPMDFDPTPGIAETLEPGLRRILAPNPSPMTFRGTNTYLLGETDLAVIDPGPDNPQHLEAILRAIQPGQQVSHILITHTHRDHSPLATSLAEATGAPVLAFGNATAGRSTVMQRLVADGLQGGGEGVDLPFRPDHSLSDGETIHGAGWALTALWTPGHMGNHLCFAWSDRVFTGDLVMGWASSLVSPPDGDVASFMSSCARLRQGSALSAFYPGHGAPITDPAQRLDWLMAHRREREAQILDTLSKAPRDTMSLVQVLYADTPPALHPAAARNVFAHLIDLTERGQLRASPKLSAEAVFERI